MRKSVHIVRVFGLFVAGVLLLSARTSQGQVVRYGNVADLGSSSDTGADFLLGTEINIPQPITLTAAGILFRTSGYNAEVGIYADNGGNPSALLGETGTFAVTSTGYVETPLLGTLSVPAGNYWFEAVYDNEASTGIAFSGGEPIDYVSQSFGSPLPNPYPVPNVYSGQTFNYYLVGNVPEPASISALGLCAFGLLARRRV